MNSLNLIMAPSLCTLPSQPRVQLRHKEPLPWTFLVELENSPEQSVRSPSCRLALTNLLFPLESSRTVPCSSVTWTDTMPSLTSLSVTSLTSLHQFLSLFRCLSLRLLLPLSLLPQLHLKESSAPARSSLNTAIATWTAVPVLLDAHAPKELHAAPDRNKMH